MLLHFLVLCCCLLSPAVVEPPVECTEAERNEFFTWFDSLGLPEIGKLPFVRVATGNWSQILGEEPQNNFAYGFSVREDCDVFEVIFTDLWRRTLRKTPEGAAPHEQVGYQPEDLERYSKKWYGEMLAEDHHRFGEKLGGRAELAVMARACSARGHAAVAMRLCDLALARPEHERDEARKTLRDLVDEEFANTFLWQAVLACGRPEISRVALLENFERIEKHFAKNEHSARVAEASRLLTIMIDEDRAHALAEPNPFDQLSAEEKIRELIFQLRDQNGHQYEQPGACDIFDDPRGPGSPASQLVAIGMAAVPQLIELLEDRRFTRSIGYFRDYHFSHHVQRYCDAAVDILERIAHRSFFDAQLYRSMSRDGKEAEVKARVVAWWARVREHGEEKVVIDEVASGSELAPWQAQRLIQIAPAKALAAIQLGIRNTQNEWVEQTLLRIAADLSDANSNEMFHALMRIDGKRGTAVAAAEIIAARGEREKATLFLIGLWNATPHADRDGLIGALLRTRDPRAAAKLREDFWKFDASGRLHLVQELAALKLGELKSLLERAEPAKAPNFEDTIEMLLIDALADVNRVEGTSGCWGSFSYKDPRVCDFSAFALNRIWSTAYPFEPKLASEEREQARIKLLRRIEFEAEIRPSGPPKPDEK